MWSSRVREVYDLGTIANHLMGSSMNIEKQDDQHYFSFILLTSLVIMKITSKIYDLGWCYEIELIKEK